MNLEFNLATLHFLRPEWFYAFIPLVLLAILFLSGYCYIGQFNLPLHPIALIQQRYILYLLFLNNTKTVELVAYRSNRNNRLPILLNSRLQNIF